ncbi:M23 family metallopeptidase [Aquabacterium sp. A7-Y]|uniref:M23 family metallopeptidase n=1 Tax=Aquabacterium sp. A7-Y TaxID=1349605 RepID=UPI00223DA140|nr:M23 family metallopeptidase [Aquabacterium sp. A7-Y]MCW7537251.1 M23 family metallopeptidase [Aquabacterium sp. A7-Y]
MGTLAWPLERNHIRRDIRNNSFGYVREGGQKAHQGWDLAATLGTPCYAIADGVIESRATHAEFGKHILLRFEHGGQTLYAAYCHLSFMLVERTEPVQRGQRIGYTGDTGNARSPHGEDQHLHFEIRTVPHPGRGLGGRIDPATLYGRAPIGWTFFEGHGQKVPTSGATGLKIRGVNVRERIE